MKGCVDGIERKGRCCRTPPLLLTATNLFDSVDDMAPNSSSSRRRRSSASYSSSSSSAIGAFTTDAQADQALIREALMNVDAVAREAAPGTLSPSGDKGKDDNSSGSGLEGDGADPYTVAPDAQLDEANDDVFDVPISNASSSNSSFRSNSSSSRRPTMVSPEGYPIAHVPAPVIGVTVPKKFKHNAKGLFADAVGEEEPLKLSSGIYSPSSSLGSATEDFTGTRRSPEPIARRMSPSGRSPDIQNAKAQVDSNNKGASSKKKIRDREGMAQGAPSSSQGGETHTTPSGPTYPLAYP